MGKSTESLWLVITALDATQVSQLISASTCLPLLQELIENPVKGLNESFCFSDAYCYKPNLPAKVFQKTYCIYCRNWHNTICPTTPVMPTCVNCYSKFAALSNKQQFNLKYIADFLSNQLLVNET